MSISIVGPQKYDFQDLICILLMLLHSKQNTPRFRVEPAGGEDALMELVSINPPACVEVQVKGEAGTISIELIADWLTHFPELQSKGALIERLLADQNRYVLMILSGGCADAVARYVVPMEREGKAHSNSKVLVRDAKLLIEKLLIQIFEQMPPTILETYDRIVEYINRMGFSNTPMAKKLALKRSEFINARSEIRGQNEEKPNSWIW